jgi:DNA-binding XRE family transcriptional regulator
MHWIQTIRTQLGLTQEELAHYLHISLHTMQSVEQGRRSLPPESLTAAMALFDAIRNAHVNRISKEAKPPASHQHMRQARQVHRICCRKLERCITRLESMKKSHSTASLALGVYEVLAQTLPTPVTQQEHAQLRWAQRKIAETTHRINNTNTGAQNILAAEIVGLNKTKPTLNIYGNYEQ